MMDLLIQVWLYTVLPVGVVFGSMYFLMKWLDCCEVKGRDPGSS